MSTILCRTVPFVGDTPDGQHTTLVLDKLKIRASEKPNSATFKLIAKSINLDEIAEQFPPAIAVDLIKEQYEVCMNYIFGHPVWESFRKGEDLNSLRAYILETRHYLFAAASRMSTGLSACWHFGPLSFVLSEHLVEEADHAIFFENALVTLGCPIENIKAAKPTPVTSEWIFLMRSISARDPLVSAVCSGLMEFSAGDREAVRGWHQMLIEKKILSAETVNKFYEHVKLDIELGHGECWIEALQSRRFITGEQLAECLNAVCLVAEMLYRWFESLHHSSSGRIVALMPQINNSSVKQPAIDNYFNGLPVLPSTLYDQAAHGEHFSLNSTVKDILAIAYHYEIVDSNSASGERMNVLVQEAMNVQKKLAAPEFIFSDYETLEHSVKGWLCSIDGHLLWKEMIDKSQLSLIYGWLIENHYYLSTAYHHCSSAIASCPYSDIRDEFIKHLKEELSHADMLEKELKKIKNVIPVRLHRPLPTTLAFTGFLRELASYDWKAYCLALAYLQFSLKPGEHKHSRFYQSITKKNPQLKSLLSSIQKHDLIDDVMGHENDMKKILELLSDKNLITAEVVARASLIAQLCWSFLDGIREHYKKGLVAVNQRLGWSSNGAAWN